MNVAWREAVCPAATAQLNQVDIRARLRRRGTHQCLAQLSQGPDSMVEFGWTPQPDTWAMAKPATAVLWPSEALELRGLRFC